MVDADLVADPTATENRLLTLGRGIYLMKTLMDEVLLEHGGAVVFLRKASNAQNRLVNQTAPDKS